MATEIRLHIGPPKTGSTSLQHALAQMRSSLASHGVLYPDFGQREDFQLHPAVYDLCMTDPSPHAMTSSSQFSRHHMQHENSFPGAWQQLVEVSEAHDGPVIWSSEIFVHLSDTAINRIATTFPDTPVHVVWIQRPPSRYLPSKYVEDARRSLVPDADAFVRRALHLLLGGPPHEFDCADAYEVTRRWTRDGWTLSAIDARPDISETTLSHALDLLAPEVADRPQLTRDNVALSALATATWADHLASARPIYSGAVIETLTWFMTAHPAVADRKLGGNLVMTPTAGHLADAAFSPTTSDSGHINEARQELTKHLAGGEPVVIVTSATIGRQDAEWIAVEKRLRRRQWLATNKWRAIDGASQLLRRRRPLRGLHRYDVTMLPRSNT